LLLVKNHQYVQSRQIIAEVRASIAPLKEKIERDIYSHIQGEVFYNPIGLRASCLKQRHFLHFLCSYSRINLWIEFSSLRSYLNPVVEKTSYIWIFSGRLNKFFNATLNLSFFYQTQDYIQRDLPIGIRNFVFNYSKVLFFSIYNRQRFVTLSVSHKDHQVGRKKKLTGYLPLVEMSNTKIFSKNTGSIHTISEQNEWILTLSFIDQFSKKMSSSIRVPERIEEQIMDLQEDVIFKYSLSKTTTYLKQGIILTKNSLIEDKDSSIGLLGQFFVLLKEFSIVSIRTFIFFIQINLFEKKINIFFYGLRIEQH